MTLPLDAARASKMLNHLCLELPQRPVGSAGNRAATDWFADRLARAGRATAAHEFPCQDWRCGGASLEVAGRPWPAEASLYSLGCQTRGRLVVALTSHNFLEQMGSITHTPQDHPDIVDPEILVQIAAGLEAVALAWSRAVSRGRT